MKFTISQNTLTKDTALDNTVITSFDKKANGTFENASVSADFPFNESKSTIAGFRKRCIQGHPNVHRRSLKNLVVGSRTQCSQDWSMSASPDLDL